jgi:hypothetical protein
MQYAIATWVLGSLPTYTCKAGNICLFFAQFCRELELFLVFSFYESIAVEQSYHFLQSFKKVIKCSLRQGKGKVVPVLN